MPKPSTKLTTDQLGQLIYEIRGERVMLDSDLASIYGVETKALNRAVKRNRDRFPKDFVFRLSEDEWKNLKYQIGTSSSGREHRSLRYQTGTSRNLPALAGERFSHARVGEPSYFYQSRRNGTHELATRRIEGEALPGSTGAQDSGSVQTPLINGNSSLRNDRLVEQRRQCVRHRRARASRLYGTREYSR
jgi:ORF6N domain-containing protein